MRRDPLISAWLMLIALSAVATAVAVLRPQGPPWAGAAAGAIILALAWAKARIVLGRYLELDQHPGPRRAVDTVLAMWALAALALHALAG